MGTRMTKQDWQITMEAIAISVMRWEDNGERDKDDLASGRKAIRWIMDNKMGAVKEPF